MHHRKLLTEPLQAGPALCLSHFVVQGFTPNLPQAAEPQLSDDGMRARSHLTSHGISQQSRERGWLWTRGLRGLQVTEDSSLVMAGRRWRGGRAGLPRLKGRQWTFRALLWVTLMNFPERERIRSRFYKL